MSVKFRAVHTGKFHFTAYCYTTGAAHTRTVHHNGVQTDNCGDIQCFSHFTGKFHHDHGTDGNTYIIGFAFLFHEILDCLGNHTASSIGSIVRGHIKITSYGLHFLFQYKKILCFGAYDNIRCDSVLMQPFYLGIYGSRTHTACYKEDLFTGQCFQILFHKFRRTSQRTYHIMESIPSLQGGHFKGSCSNNLENDSNRSRFSVIIADCKRNSFRIRILSYDYKLSWFTGFCNPFRFHYHQKNVRGQFSCL